MTCKWAAVGEKGSRGHPGWEEATPRGVREHQQGSQPAAAQVAEGGGTLRPKP